MSMLLSSRLMQDVGPVISFNAAGQAVIVLNDHKSAFELLGACRICSSFSIAYGFSTDRRSRIYSDRPPFIKAGEIMGGGIMLSFVSYGDLYV